ncbi:MAG: sulfurtransferase [Bacteroidetes bacterium]|nr:MAG: sulfurtransferase [Bacteroidota bacterium]
MKYKLIIAASLLLILGAWMNKSDLNSSIQKVEFESNSIDKPQTLFVPSQVDYEGFLELVKKVKEIRRGKLVELDTFLAMAKDHKTVILDTRSEAKYKSKHIKGAVHLNFSDFSSTSLKNLIPDSDTRVLIYCNNNFFGDEVNFVLKSRPLALNIPTYINLVGYGYKNVYELSDLHSIDDSQLIFEGKSVESLKLKK